MSHLGRSVIDPTPAASRLKISSPGPAANENRGTSSNYRRLKDRPRAGDQGDGHVKKAYAAQRQVYRWQLKVFPEDLRGSGPRHATPRFHQNTSKPGTPPMMRMLCQNSLWVKSYAKMRGFRSTRGCGLRWFARAYTRASALLLSEINLRAVFSTFSSVLAWKSSVRSCLPSGKPFGIPAEVLSEVYDRPVRGSLSKAIAFFACSRQISKRSSISGSLGMGSPVQRRASPVRRARGRPCDPLAIMMPAHPVFVTHYVARHRLFGYRRSRSPGSRAPRRPNGFSSQRASPLYMSARVPRVYAQRPCAGVPDSAGRW